MRLALIAAGLLLVGLAGRAGAPTVARDRVLFADGFDGDQLDREHWRTCHWWASRGCTIKTNDELEWYLPGQVSVTDGTARLTAARGHTAEGDRRHRFLSGMLSTGPGPESAPGFAFLYGRVSIRAQLPDGDGLWPALWMLPADRRSEPEIDILEVKSDESDTAYASLHLSRAGQERSYRRASQGLAPGWHTFTLDWRPARLEWLIDGKRTWLVSGSRVPRELMYLVMNLAVSGDPPPTRATPSPATMQIDWVQVTR